MRTFTLTNQAKADLKSIAAYTQRKWGKDQRGTYVRQLDDAFHMLSENPELGNKCDFIVILLNQGIENFQFLVIFFSSVVLANLKLSLYVYYINVWMLKHSLKPYNA